MEKRNREKAALLYRAIDARPDVFTNPVENEVALHHERRLHAQNPELEAEFLAEAKALKMEGLKGIAWSAVIRASIYNAVPLEAVAALADLIKSFKPSGQTRQKRETRRDEPTSHEPVSI
jgi:phosphoserine aminotransferase